MTLTKADLVHKIYQTHELSKTEATETIEAFLRISKECLSQGEDLLISGFGKFNVKDKKPLDGALPPLDISDNYGLKLED